MIRRLLTSRLVTAVLVTVVTCWLAGFLWFVNVASRYPEAPPPHTDGIVALTGGAGRVELALHRLANGQADRLLLSGIGGGTELATLGRLSGVDTADLADRITLGRYAASTRGNGVETAAWAEQNGVGSLVVVTAAFHMPRALAELRQALPGIRLFPLPVRSWNAEKGPGLKTEAEEYTKYILTASGLSAWFPHREPTSAPGMRASNLPGPNLQAPGILAPGPTPTPATPTPATPTPATPMPSTTSPPTASPRG